MSTYTIESCVSTLAEAKLAENNGANRLELCARLDLDGLTPGVDLVRQVLSAVQIPVKVMIRHRDGNLCYSNEDMEQIFAHLDLMKACGAKHFVYGSMADGHLDLGQLEEVLSCLRADDYPVQTLTIHKAIDTSTDIIRDLSMLIKSKVYRDAKKANIGLAVLTSGGATTAMEGKDMLRKLIQLAENRLEIICAGRITYNNLPEHKSVIGGYSYHGRRIIPLSH